MASICHNTPGMPGGTLARSEFRNLRLQTPHDNLCTAIGLIQAHILAGDSALIPEMMFGNFHFRQAGLETAVAMLVAILGEAEDLQWIEEKAA